MCAVIVCSSACCALYTQYMCLRIIRDTVIREQATQESDLHDTVLYWFHAHFWQRFQACPKTATVQFCFIQKLAKDGQPRPFQSCQKIPEPSSTTPAPFSQFLHQIYLKIPRFFSVFGWFFLVLFPFLVYLVLYSFVINQSQSNSHLQALCMTHVDISRTFQGIYQWVI